MSEGKMYGDSGWFAPDAEPGPQVNMDAIFIDVQVATISAKGVNISLYGNCLSASCEYDLLAGISLARGVCKDHLTQARKTVSLAQLTACGISKKYDASAKLIDELRIAADTLLIQNNALNIVNA